MASAPIGRGRSRFVKWRIFGPQLAICAFCLAAIWLWAANFPFPSPLIKPLLPPRARWPTEQVMHWVDSGIIDKGYLAFFNRDPERTVPAEGAFVSPADGRVKYILTQDGETYFVVGLSFWDVHVVRTPVAGTVVGIEGDGEVVSRGFSETKDLIFLREKDGPVQKIITIRTTQGDIKLRLITSYWASRLKVWVRVGQKLQKGERVGRILLGSSVAVDFPWHPEFAVEAGERVVGGETVIVK